MPFTIQLSAIMRPVLQEQTAKPVKTVNTVRIAPKTEEAAVCANNSRPSKQKPSQGMVFKILLAHLNSLIPAVYCYAGDSSRMLKYVLIFY